MSILCGFTLIELIVVIVIIGILAAIVIPRLSGFSNSAQITAAEAGAKTIATAYSTLYAQDPTAAGATATALLDEGDAALTDLTGPIDGALTNVTCSADGDIGFTYTENGIAVVYANSTWVSTT